MHFTGGRIFLKAETLQRTGSFKFRGAYNRLAAIPESARAGGVVAFSSGNHAQGIAAAAELLRHAGSDRDAGGCAASEARTPPPWAPKSCCMIANAKTAKGIRARSRSNAARCWCRLMTIPRDCRAGYDGSRDWIDDLASLGLTPDIIVVNASGGGLAAGIALTVKARTPTTQIYTAEPAGFDDHARSFKKRSARKEPA